MRACRGEAIREVTELARRAIDLHAIRPERRLDVDGARIGAPLEQVEAACPPTIDLELRRIGIGLLVHIERVVRGSNCHPIPRLREISAGVVLNVAIAGTIRARREPIKLLLRDHARGDLLARLVRDGRSPLGVGSDRRCCRGCGARCGALNTGMATRGQQSGRQRRDDPRVTASGHRPA